MSEYSAKEASDTSEEVASFRKLICPICDRLSPHLIVIISQEFLCGFKRPSFEMLTVHEKLESYPAT